MADPGGNILVQKWGPAPAWVWAAGSLVLLWVVAKWRDMKKASTADQQPETANAAGDYASEGQAVAPQFIIENNMPESYVPVPTPTPGPTPPASTPVVVHPGPIRAPVTPPATTTKPPTSTKPAPPPAKKPPSKPPLKYEVKHGDTLSAIAARYKNPNTGKPFTAAELFTFNTTPGVRPASTIATLKQRGPGLIYAGETILIPQ